MQWKRVREAMSRQLAPPANPRISPFNARPAFETERKSARTPVEDVPSRRLGGNNAQKLVRLGTNSCKPVPMNKQLVFRPSRPRPLSRRSFIGLTVGPGTMVAALPWTAAAAVENPDWPIGCFNRAWTNWSYDEALDAIAAAGYKLTGLLSGHQGEAFTSSAATPEYLDSLKKRIAQRGLTVNMSALRFRTDAPLGDNIADVRKQLDNAARLGLKFMLTFGVDRPIYYDNFYRLMADAALQGEKRGIQIAMKPHGGSSGASVEILRCIEKVGSANFRIWYDAGNIIYYTGKDPVLELEPIARFVTGFCAKDCPAPKGEVMSQFGTGKVDFKAVFAKLKSVGFKGPIMVEGVKVGATPVETTANARANREFLERTIATV